MPLRIAFVTTRLDINDGVASHIELLAKNLVSSEVDLSMITGLVTGQNVATERYSMLKQLFPAWHQLVTTQLRPTPTVIRRLRSVIHAGSYDAIHVHGVKALLLLRMAVGFTRIPIFTTYHPSAHGVQASDFSLGVDRNKQFMYRMFLELTRPDCFFALSSDTYDLFVNRIGWGAARVRRVICGIDLQHYRPPSSTERQSARSHLHLQAEDFVIVLPGRLNLNKGHDVVISALGKLHAEVPDRALRCLFPGAGAQGLEIEGLIARSSSPEMFRMLGFVPDMRLVYWAADAVVLPSRSEGFALVVAEAMACGCPALRTPSGGCSDQIVEGVTGFVVPFNDPVILSDRIALLLDPAKLEQMRTSAATFAHSAFSGDRMASETWQAYIHYA